MAKELRREASARLAEATSLARFGSTLISCRLPHELQLSFRGQQTRRADVETRQAVRRTLCRE
eukprot:6025920-Pleurochrysis_carterae.AAC.2